jgi:hypothetical protein
MNIKTTLASIALGTAALLASGAAYATTAPGEQVGLDEASPLPEGIFLIDTARLERVAGIAHQGGSVELLENIPIIAWSTPWHILGARLEILAAAPYAGINDVVAPGWVDGQVAPVAGYALAWNFGALSVSNIQVEYAPSNNRIGSGLGLNVWTFRDTLATTYKLGGGLTFMADATINLTSNDQQTGHAVQNSSFLYDLSLLKSFGKWTVGAVAFGTSDIENKAGPETFRNAAGGLVGYDFGPVILQGFLTHDYDNSKGTPEASTFWTRAIIPLWVAPAEPLK